MKLQLRVRNELKTTANGQMVITVFSFGPIEVAVLANVPPKGQTSATSYVKLEFARSGIWEDMGDDDG